MNETPKNNEQGDLKKKSLGLLKRCSPDILITKNEDALSAANEMAKALNAIRTLTNINFWPKGYNPPTKIRFVGNTIVGQKFDTEKTIISKSVDFPLNPMDFLEKLENFLRTGMIFNKNTPQKEIYTSDVNISDLFRNNESQNNNSYKEKKNYMNELVYYCDLFGFDSIPFQEKLNEAEKIGHYKREQLLSIPEITKIVTKDIMYSLGIFDFDSIPFRNKVASAERLGIFSREKIFSWPEVKVKVKNVIIYHAKLFGKIRTPKFTNAVEMGIFTEGEILSWPELYKK